MSVMYLERGGGGLGYACEVVGMDRESNIM